MKPKIVFHDQKIEIPIKNGEVVFSYGDLIYAECDKPFCNLHFVNEKTVYSVEISLKRLLENLPQKVFFQCNRQNIINISHYKRYTTKPPVIEMENGKKLTLSYRKIVAFRSQKACIQLFLPCSAEDCPNLNFFGRSSKT